MLEKHHHSISIQNEASVVGCFWSKSCFAVTVTQTGGYNGTGTWPNGSSPASWTYTVKTADGTVTLGVNIQLTKPRSSGAVSPGNGFGLAFYQADGNLQLWDAGEVPNYGYQPFYAATTSGGATTTLFNYPIL